MILLDTHILLWLLDNPEKLTKKAKASINKARRQKQLLVSSITVWELSFLIKKQRLKLTMDLDSWLNLVYKVGYIKFIPIDNRIAQKSVFLSEPLHKDPADRIIIATALQNGAKLVTSDKRILKYPFIQSVW